MAQKQVITWTCDCCGHKANSPNKRTMPPLWGVHKLKVPEAEIDSVLDLCEYCINDVMVALANPTRPPSKNGA